MYGYRALNPPIQSDEILQVLISTANANGIIYTSPKGKEKEVTSRMDKDVPSTSMSFDSTSSTSFNHSEVLEMIKSAPALFVSVECPVRGYGHAIFQAKKCADTERYQPLTALYFYQSLCYSSNIQVEFINKMVDHMRPNEIRLGTACRPIYIDEKHLFGWPSTGFHHLGYLEDLDQGVLIKPVVNNNDKKDLLKMNNLDENLDMYILYIWTVVSLTSQKAVSLR